MKNIYSILALFLAFTAQAQVAVTGLVKSTAGAPLELVAVYAQGRSAMTNAEGRFELSLPVGEVLFRFSRPGYKTLHLRKSIGKEPIFVEVIFEEHPFKTEEVVISGVRAGNREAISEKTVAKTDIEKQFVGQDALFLLERTTPSIVANSESGSGFSNYGSFRLRGIDQSRINMTLNGVPLNDMIDQGVFFSNFTDFANSVQSMQVQRGVGLSTNGTASYAGSINFESMSLSDTAARTEVQLSGGSFGTMRSSVEHQTGLLKNGWGFYGKASGFQTDGFRDHSGTQSYSLFLSGGYFGKRDLLKITAFTGRTRNQMAYFPVPWDLVQQNPRTNANFKQDRDNFGQSFFQVHHTRFFNPNTHLSSSVYYGGAGGDFQFGFNDEEGNFLQWNYPLQNHHVGGMTTLHTASEDGNWVLETGLHAYTFRRRNWEFIEPKRNEIVYDDRTTKNEAAAFARLSRKLGKTRLFLDQQLRSVSLSFTPDPDFVNPTEKIPVRNWLFYNPKLGIQHELSRLVDLYATAGYTQREPTRFDILNGGVNVDASNLFLVQDVQAVKPESVFDVEAGIKLKGEKLSGQANLFNMEFRNEIQAIGGFSQFVPIRKNIERSFRRGLELDLAYKINEQVSLFGNLTLMQTGIKSFRKFVDAESGGFGKDTSLVFNNVEAVLSPNAMGRLGVQVALLKGLDVSLSTRYVGEQFVELTNNADFVLPSFTLLDAQVSYRFWKNHSLLLMVNNLTNQRYYTFGTGDPLSDRRPNVFVQAPINVMAMLKLQF